jgi:hypothetical protein
MGGFRKLYGVQGYRAGTTVKSDMTPYIGASANHISLAKTGRTLGPWFGVKLSSVLSRVFLALGGEEGGGEA